MGTWWVNSSELDEDQRRIQCLGIDDKSYHITGTPGSGKTNLLLLRANYLYLSKVTNICIIVFTRVLKEFIVNGADKYSFPLEKIMTFNGWARQFIYDNNIEFDCRQCNDFEDTVKHYTKIIKDYITKNELKNYYDVILIDESQDYEYEQIEIFKLLSKSIYLTSDSKQQLYKRKRMELEKVVDETFELKYHFRNGLQICKLADKIQKDDRDYLSLEQYCNYDESSQPSSVIEKKFDNDDDLFESLHIILTNQIIAYPDEFIGVVCAKTEMVNKISSYFSDKDIYNNMLVQISSDYKPFEDGKTICIGTINSFKGLEFRACHIVKLDDFESMPQPRNKLYTAITRAKTSLTLFSTGKIPGYIEQALYGEVAKSTNISPEDAFGSNS